MGTKHLNGERELSAVVVAHESHGYGHVELYVYGVLPYGTAVLKATSQIGSHYSGRMDNDAISPSYGWKVGLANDYDVVDVAACAQGLKALRRIVLRTDRQAAKGIRPRSFADYALNILRALRVASVQVKGKALYEETTSKLDVRNPAQRLDFHTQVLELENSF